MTKEKIINILETECIKRKISVPHQINIDVFTREEAFFNDIDDETFSLSEGKPIDFYLCFMDCSDYDHCLIPPNSKQKETRKLISDWLDKMFKNNSFFYFP